MRCLIVITVLLGIGYSQCNESNWQEYYNSEGHNMEGCWLDQAFLPGKDLQYANLSSASLWWTNLNNADLSAETLDFANLMSAQLADINLEEASLCNLVATPAGDYCYEQFQDQNGDHWDDESYDMDAMSGDVNLDGANDILDVVAMVYNILNP